MNNRYNEALRGIQGFDDMVNINPFKVFLMATTTLLFFPITEVYGQDSKVSRVQRALVGSGYDPGPVDGYWGNNTASALSQIAKARACLGSKVKGRHHFRSACGFRTRFSNSC